MSVEIDDKTCLEIFHSCSEIGLWTWEVKTNTLCFDDQWCSLFGFKHEELETDFSSFKNLIHPGDLVSVMQSLDNLFPNQNQIPIPELIVLSFSISDVFIKMEISSGSYAEGK